jgi:hypothetical protein
LNPYSSFPVLYDSLNGYNPSQFSLLQPYGFIPQFSQSGNPYYAPNTIPQGDNNIDAQYRNGREKQETVENAPATQPPTVQPEAAAPVPAEQAAEQIPDAIKNNANKNKDIPDVPPPPIPSGGRTEN